MNRLYSLFSFLTSDVITSESGETSSSSSIDWNEVINTIINWLTTNGIKLLIGIIVLFLGFKIVNAIANRVQKKMLAKGKEKTLVSVVYRGIKYGLKFIILFFVVTYVGIETSGMAAIISSLGVGISLAVQGSLSNFAGGIVILVMKPFKIGDYINAQGCSGTVEEIKMFYTYLATPDNKVQMIPNGVLANDVIENVSAKDKRRVDLKFSIAYGESVLETKKIIMDKINNNELILKDAVPFVRVSEYGDSSIDITVRVWCMAENYWDIYFTLTEEVNSAIMEAGIEIPYNKLDVTVTNASNNDKNSEI